jgi:hypothetical protein
MRAIFTTALVCSVASLVGVLGLSAMTIVPSPGAETWRWRMVATAAAFLAGWLGLAIWARRRIRLFGGVPAPPSWLGPTVVAAGAIYVLAVLLFAVG